MRFKPAQLSVSWLHCFLNVHGADAVDETHKTVPNVWEGAREEKTSGNSMTGNKDLIFWACWFCPQCFISARRERIQQSLWSETHLSDGDNSMSDAL